MNLVSIITPVYNTEKFLAECIVSVLQQTHTNWELLIIDDGSVDGSADIVKRFSDPRIRYFYQANQGVSAARNVGFHQMRGDFFCFLDSDDVMPPHSLAERLAVLDRNKSVHFADGTVKIFDASLTRVVGIWTPSFRGFPFKRLIRLDDRCFFGCTWMARVVPGYTYAMDTALRHGEDLLFFLSVAHQGAYDYTEAVTVHYRRNPWSAMNNLDGLAKGYTQLREKIGRMGISQADRLFLQFKTRKIMFLSFIAARKFGKAVRYLLRGSI